MNEDDLAEYKMKENERRQEIRKRKRESMTEEELISYRKADANRKITYLSQQSLGSKASKLRQILTTARHKLITK